MKRFFSLLLALCLVGCVPAVSADMAEPPAGEDDILPPELFSIGTVSESGDLNVYDAGGQYDSGPVLRLMLDGASDLPVSYDPRDSGELPAVRRQGVWNTCWAVSAIGIAEIAAIRMGLDTVSSVDLSERHLAYFLSHQADDPLGNSSGDYNTNPSLWISSGGGGNPILASMTLAGWHGAADEAATDSAYSGMKTNDYISSSYAYADVLHLQNTYSLSISTAAERDTLKQMLLDYGGAVLCMHYSSRYLFSGSPTEAAKPAPTESPSDPEPDPTKTDAPIDNEEPDPTDPDIQDPDAAEPVAEDTGLTDTDTQDPGAAEPDAEDTGFPDTDTRDPDAAAPDAESLSTDGDADTEESGLTDTDTRDPALTEPDDPEQPDVPDVPETPATPTDFTVCYYRDSIVLSSDGRAQTNHEVVIVGWDDNYPKENFGWSSAGLIPPADGAWLCRNSYGNDWAGGDGYFWVSYYDATISESTDSMTGHVTVFDFSSADNYDNLYEYDGAAIPGYVNDYLNQYYTYKTDAVYNSWKRYYANVFTASAVQSGYELLRAVSTYSYRSGVGYTVSVYTGLTDPADPTSGTLKATQSGTFSYPGLHTISLREAVRLEEGESFSIVFSVSRGNDDTIIIPSCYTNSAWYSTNETLEGQSFVSPNGTDWTDGTDLCYVYKNDNDKLVRSPRPQNVRIKAYTDSFNTELLYDADLDGIITTADAALYLSREECLSAAFVLQQLVDG